ncbi:MAG: DUF4440 domain-containing protein [Maribacter sp.]
MKFLFFVLSLVLLFSCDRNTNEVQDKKEIKSILMTQQEAWSKNDIDGFMKGYWKSNSLKFYSGANLRRGWQNTLDSYKVKYLTLEHSGKLKFSIADITQINKDAYWVMGEYHLTRDMGDAKSTFLIIFKRINGNWKIVADSSC